MYLTLLLGNLKTDYVRRIVGRTRKSECVQVERIWGAVKKAWRVEEQDAKFLANRNEARIESQISDTRKISF